MSKKLTNEESAGIKGIKTFGEECFKPSSNIAAANSDSNSLGNFTSNSVGR